MVHMVLHEEEAGDWSNVPDHIVELIMNKLKKTPAEISDYIRCGTICMSWRTVFIHHYHHPPPCPRPVTLPPFLIVPTPSSSSSSSTKKKKKKNTKSLSFYNIIDKKVYDQFQVTIPSNRHFRGSSHGWLVAVDQDNDCQIRLFNPFLSASSVVPCYSSSPSRANDNKSEILLPSLKNLSILTEENVDDHDTQYYCEENVDDHDTQYYYYCLHNSPTSYAYLKKVVLSADPLSNPTDYIVMAIFGSPGKLAYCRPGGGGCHNKDWTLVEFEYDKYVGFIDVMYYKGKFFALHFPGTVVVLDPTCNMMAVTLKIPHRPRSRIFSACQDTMYLVESAGVLLQVYREIEIADEDTVIKREPYLTTRFRVFKLVDETKKGRSYDIAKVNHYHQKQNEEGEYGAEKLKWKLLKNLGGRTLFLGDNHSMWIRASDYPGCRPNSIYFTDDFMAMYHCTPWNGPHDLGVFSLEDDTIENHYPTDHNTPIWPVPIWIQTTILASADFGTYCASVSNGKKRVTEEEAR